MIIGGRPLAAALVTAALLWTLALIAAPLAVAAGERRPVVAALYAASGLICHQRPARSFFIDRTQMPVCARCFGLYASGAVGALAAFAAGARRVRAGSRAVRLALACAAAPTAITVAAEWLGLVSPSNVARAVAAVPLGAAAGWIFARLLYQPD